MSSGGGGSSLPIIGDVLNYLGQREANDTNVDIAHNANVHNAQQAALDRRFQAEQARGSMMFEDSQARNQMLFQERMSNTAYQRAREDMEKAGINPMIAALGNGASSPSGAAGSGAAGSGSRATANTTRVENALGAFANTALKVQQLEQGDANIRLTDAQTKKTLTDEKVSEKGIPKSELMNDVYDVVRPYVKQIKEAIETHSAQKAKTWQQKFDEIQHPVPINKPR